VITGGMYATENKPNEQNEQCHACNVIEINGFLIIDIETALHLGG
jgi:hypothetical protein